MTLSEIVVRKSEDSDRRAVRMLLPGVDQREIKPVTFVAAKEADNRVIAAAALFPWPLGTPPGFKFAIRVAKPYRHRGIGKRLVDKALVESARRRIGYLYAAQSVEPSSEEAAAWRALGFDRHQFENLYETAPRRLVERLSPLCEKMQRLGWIPRNVKIIALGEARPKDVARLHVKHLGGSLRQIMARIAGQSAVRYDREHSKVMVIDDRVCGIMLSRQLDPTISMVEAFVIEPELRMGWANALLKLHTAQDAVEYGRKGIRFITYDTHRDTRQFAADNEAILLNSRIIPYRVIGRG